MHAYFEVTVLFIFFLTVCFLVRFYDFLFVCLFVCLFARAFSVFYDLLVNH